MYNEILSRHGKVENPQDQRSVFGGGGASLAKCNTTFSQVHKVTFWLTYRSSYSLPRYYKQIKPTLCYRELMPLLEKSWNTPQLNSSAGAATISVVRASQRPGRIVAEVAFSPSFYQPRQPNLRAMHKALTRVPSLLEHKPPQRYPTLNLQSQSNTAVNETMHIRIASVSIE